MGLLELIADIPTNATLRVQAQALEKKIGELEKENASLKKELVELKQQVAANTKAEDFVEHRGVLFKRKPSGGYHLAVYCPRCKLPMGALEGVQYSCESCMSLASFGSEDLPGILKELA